jgi:proline racemase
MMKRRAWFERHAEDLRGVAILEPRGHRDLVGALFTEPVSRTADAGLIFVDAGGYPMLSGAAVVAAATIALERGLITKTAAVDADDGGRSVQLEFDTPIGAVMAVAEVEVVGARTRVAAVRVTGVPTFVADAGREVSVGHRRLRVDLAYSGAFYAVIDSEAVGVALHGDRLAELRRIAADVGDALDGDATLVHPEQAVEPALRGAIFTAPPQVDGAHLRTVTMLTHGGCDRAPSVTDSGALMGILHAMGLLQPGDDFVHEGLLGLTGRGRIVQETRVADLPAIVPEVTASAWITGEHTLVADDHDPLRNGFAL